MTAVSPPLAITSVSSSTFQGFSIGSSPQEGTRDVRRSEFAPSRFILASAGNTAVVAAMLYLDHGSSPQARGTHRRSGNAGVRHRFIPASAGNTTARTATASSTSVHPRKRGEHCCIHRRGSMPYGSSPQARGTLDRPARAGGDGRFIPASAGNTSTPAPRPSRPTVHPRKRGEHCDMLARKLLRSGSSPQARGTLRRGGAPLPRCRFIPASAGNTV